MSCNENLANAFAGESQANRKYLAFAKKAEADGYPQVAKLFRAAAAAETVHAHAHLKAMGGIKTTMENLEEAVDGEGFEFREMYPPYVQKAVEEGNKQAEITCRNAMNVEKIHHEMYENALAAVKGNSDLPDRKVYVCEICGNTVYDEAQENCSVCGAPKNKFFEIN